MTDSRIKFEKKLDELSKKIVKFVLDDNDPVRARNYIRERIRELTKLAAFHPEWFIDDGQS